MDSPEPVVWRIVCDECVMLDTNACEDCVVTFLCTRDEEGAAVIDVSEARALRLLHTGGLTPALRHRRRTG
jgi:hypothetical protein